MTPLQAPLTAAPTGPDGAAVGLGLLLLVLFAGAVRLVGLDYGLPHRIEPDVEVAEQVKYLRAENPSNELASAYATYPRLLAHLTAAALSAPREPQEIAWASHDEHLRLASQDYLDTRLVAALVSLLAIPATFFIARRFVAAPFALLAAALVASSLLSSVFARQARPHAPAAALVACAVWTHLRLLERGTLSSWIAAGVVTGLAMASLQSAVALCLPLAAALALRPSRRWLEPRALPALALIAVAVVLAYPALSGGLPEGVGSRWDEREGFVRIEDGWLTFGNHRVPVARFSGGGVASLARTLWWYEPGLAWLLALAAALWCVERRMLHAERAPRRPLGVVLAYVLPYLGVLALFDDTFERFLLPALPFLACFAAWGVAAATRRLGPRAAVALVLPALLGAAASARLAYLHTRPDTLEEAAGWVSANVGTDERVFLSPVPNYVLKDSAIDLPLVRRHASLRGLGGARIASYNAWTHYQRRLNEEAIGEPRFRMRWLVLRLKHLRELHPGLARNKRAYLAAHPEVYFEETGPGYFVIEDQRARPANRSHNGLQDALAKLGTRVARFAPDSSGFPFGYQDRVQLGESWPHPLGRTLLARTTGPVVEIWRVELTALADAE